MFLFVPGGSTLGGMAFFAGSTLDCGTIGGGTLGTSSYRSRAFGVTGAFPDG